MAITGIIAEFNPFHLGHQALVDTLHANGDTVICVLSGNFVQRGDVAVFPKIKRAEMALRCGVDLVAELPVCWAMSTAQNFALGGVAQLMALGCDKIAFGSESGDLDALLKTAEILSRPDFKQTLDPFLSSGITFAKARQMAAEQLGAPIGILENPNDNLAIEYILAAKKSGFKGLFFAFKRVGADHNSAVITNESVSASLLREHLQNGDISFAEQYMPVALKGKINPNDIADIFRLETAILACLRAKSVLDFKQLPDLSEGLENKLMFCIQQAGTLEELYNGIKSKRYPLSRIRRLVLSAFLEIPAETFLTVPPYVRILGCNTAGEKVLQTHTGTVPVITRALSLKSLTGFAQTVFNTECRAGDLYALSLPKPLPCGSEYTMKFLKTE